MPTRQIELPKGRVYEKKFFGRQGSTHQPRFVARKTSLCKTIDLYKKNGWNPEPRTRYAKDFFAELRKHFPGELARKLKLYCSLGTPLDWWHGIDGFVELEKSVVTLDLTTVENKQDVKADILVPEAIFSNPEKFAAKVREVAQLLKIWNDHGILAYD